LTVTRIEEARARHWLPGPSRFLQRIRDLLDRGRLDFTLVRLGDLVRWLLGRRGESQPSLEELCGVLESAARLALLKSRRLVGHSDEALLEQTSTWTGPPPELPIRRSWLASRLALGPLSHIGPARAHAESSTRMLAPIAPMRLRAVFLALDGRERAASVPTIAPKIVRASVEHTSARILVELEARGEVMLHEIAGDTRDARVAAFLACLTLARQGRVSLVQDELFGRIVIVQPAEASEALA